MSNDSRNEILSKIAAVRSNRAAAIDIQTPEAIDIYKPILPDPITCFINELEAINGKCFLCENETEIFKRLKLFTQIQNIKSIFCRDSTISKQLAEFNIPFSDNPSDFEQMQAGITSCEYLVARTGSVIVSSASESGRQMNVFPPIHIVIAKTNQISDYLTNALTKMQIKYGNEFPSTISTMTGPSRTADIEKTLVLGAHGPKEFIVFLSKT